MRFDRHGNRIWRETEQILDSERLRHGLGEVAVPYGRCSEPTNVQAGGGQCGVSRELSGYEWLPRCWCSPIGCSRLSTWVRPTGLGVLDRATRAVV